MFSTPTPSTSACADVLQEDGPRRNAGALPRTSSQRKPRKPNASNTILPSTYRPHVLAEDRLGSWTTPFGVRFHASSSSSISTPASVKLHEVMLLSLEPGTRKNYGAGLLRFTQFCDCQNVPEDARMPASDHLLASFVAQWHGVVSRSTVDTWVAGLTFWHSLNGAPWLGGKMLRAVCKAVLKGAPPGRDKRPPVTLEHLYALRERLDLSNSFDAAVYAVACCAFWGCRRLGELVVPSAGEFNPERHVSKSADLRFHSPPASRGYATLPVPFTKTTSTRGALFTFTDVDDPTSPVPALRRHRAVNGSVPDHAPFFAFETADGWAPMTRDWFLSRCNEIWGGAGLGLLSGHCFRIGGATELLLRGVPPDIVQVLGGWKSQAFLEYWRKVDSILPLFISNSFTASRMQLLRTSMDAFARRHACNT